MVLAAGALAASTLFAGVRVGTFLQQRAASYTTADGLPSDDVRGVVVRGGSVYALTAAGDAVFDGSRWRPSAAPAAGRRLGGLEEAGGEVRQVAEHGGRVAVAAANGLFLRRESGGWETVTPQQGGRRWALHDVRGVAFDSGGALWFASPQGAGRYDGAWTLYTGAEGLPYDDFTAMAAAPDGSVWFGTRRGAIRFDGKAWEYRQGRRWLPDDDVRAVAVDAAGSAFFATAGGVGVIRAVPVTLAGKAKFFEDEIDKRHRRTPFGYVDSVTLHRPDDLSAWVQRDSDNDGLWTSMYGSGECFAWAATRQPEAKRRARAAFEALRFLGTVTQGGSNPAPRGFVARTILPASGPDPNAAYTAERDRAFRETRDRRWKVIVPRWPLSADGQWYWKCDTSSDELDGHYFFYANYYDLAADSEEERRRVREHVAALTDHLVEHGFRLVDHDGKPTRWGIFDPRSLNHDPLWWEERGLNSLSMLAYLRTAEHITGDAKYGQAARKLIDEQGYAMNVAIPKSNAGPGSGNQSDDEMAFMNFYCLMKYEKDPLLRRLFGLAFYQRWRIEQPELNPLFNFIYAATAQGLSFPHDSGDRSLAPRGGWLEESVETLKRYPFDRRNWALANSHRKDVRLLPGYVEGRHPRRGHRVDGLALPIDERYVDKWNHDPWTLDTGGDGRQLADGASFLLPYYMGLYHGFLEE